MQINSGRYASQSNRQAVARAQNKFTSNAQQIFSGPAETAGSRLAASFLNATNTEDQFKQFVKNNVEKFSGNTLKAMLVATDLVDWYQAKQQDEIKKAAQALSEKMGAIGGLGVDLKA